MGPGDHGRAIDPAIVRAAIDSAPDAIVITDDAGAIGFVNRAAEALFGYAPGELVGQPIDVLIPDHLRVQHRADHAAYTAKPVSRPMGLGLDLRARHRQGHDIPVEIGLSPVAAERPYVIAVVRDVTERRRVSDELAAARARVAIADDRERIARDLHDTVIQRLFATGLGLESSLRGPELAERVEVAVVAIDAAIKDLRTSIFSLRRPPDVVGTADALRVTAEEARRILMCPLIVEVGSDLDRGVPIALRDELVAVVREALTNVAKHAAAREARLAVGLENGSVVVRVTDDGTGFDTSSPKAGHGLRSLAERARVLGGHCTVLSSAGGGTRIEWAAPLDA